MGHLLRDAGIDRGRELVTWNVVGWYVGDGSRIREVSVRDMDEARDSLRELVGREGRSAPSLAHPQLPR